MANIKRANTSGITKSGAAISDVPDAPTIGAVTDVADGSSATVAFTAATTGGAVTTYTATSTPGTITGTSATSPITVTGLSAGTAYTFKVKGTNSTATGPESAASASVTLTLPPLSAFDSIATINCTDNTTTLISFTSIPQTYTHLQLRGYLQVYGGSQGGANIRFNNDSAANYAHHQFGGGAYDGTTRASGYTSQNQFNFDRFEGSTTAVNVFSPMIVDVYNYSSTTINKTAKQKAGIADNGLGYEQVYISTGHWRNTSAITRLDFFINGSTALSQYSSFALYGIKGA